MAHEDTCVYEARKVDVLIKNDKTGEVVFQKDGFEVPVGWSDRAATIASSKYATDEEFSAFTIIDRVINQITTWGVEQGYFDEDDEGSIDEVTERALGFKATLKEILVFQRAAFNSPVFFNVGVPENPSQCSACFVLPIEDNMDSILGHYAVEGNIFKGGSGAGMNISKLRAKGEKLSNKGHSSGPVGFCRGFDKSAGTIKSAGKVRRAAKLVCMDVDHPDIEEFIECKTLEENKAKILVASGIEYDEAYSTVDFQNTNHSIRVTDQFMNCVETETDWDLVNRGDKKVARVISAKELLMKVAENTWITGDPGIQYDDRMNLDNPVPSLDKIRSTNPCQPGFATVLTPQGVSTFDDIGVGSTIWSGKQWTEVTHKRSTGIKSVNEYKTTVGSFIGTKNHRVFENDKKIEVKDAKGIDVAVYNITGDGPIGAEVSSTYLIEKVTFLGEFPVYDITVSADEHSYWTGGMLVANCSEFSAVNNSSCNLSSLNLVEYWDGLEFDWRLFAKDIRILVTAMDILIDAADYPTPEIREVTTSTRPLGLGFSNLGALLMSRGIPYDSDKGRNLAANITKEMTTVAYYRSTELAEQLGSFKHFEENKETNLEIAGRLTDNTNVVAKIKKSGLRNSQLTLLAPCGTISFLMDCDSTGVEPLFAIKSIKTLVGGGTMEINPDCVAAGVQWIKDNKQEFANLDNEHIIQNIDVFDTSNDISWKGHLGMMAAVQSHLSGAISKTINMPPNCTVQDIFDVYIEAWKLGVKAVAVYRDGSKGNQPLTVVKNPSEALVIQPNQALTEAPRTRRERLPDDRNSKTHKFSIVGHEGYLTVGMYPDGSPGEMFIKMQKEGSTMSGLMDSFAVAISLMLQYGVPLDHMIDKFKGSKFEPQGITQNSSIMLADSIIDYIFKWVEQTFMNDPEAKVAQEEIIKTIKSSGSVSSEYGPPCSECGAMTIKAGSCFYCGTCGSSSGCS